MAKIKLPVYKNEDLTVEVTDLTYQGMGVAKVDGYLLFIDGALTGETVEVHVVKVTKNYGYAKINKILKESPNRTQHANNTYMRLGIAPLYHLGYDAQLDFKQKIIEDLLKKEHLKVKVAKTIGSKNILHYRNKAQIPVREAKNQLETGFFKKNSHDFVAVEDFLIQDKRIDEIIKNVRNILRKYAIKPYDEIDNRGTIRHIMVRRGYYTKQAMVVLVTRTNKLEHGEQIANEIRKVCPDVLSVLQNVNSKRTNVILGEKMKLISGVDKIEDKLNGLKFKISAQSFYQVNPIQTEVLYNKVIEAARLDGTQIVVDAYCGIGTIALSLAKYAKKVYGVEIVPQAILDAKQNAKLNKIENVSFIENTSKDQFIKWKDEGLKPDIVIFDPPRKGLTESLIESTKIMAPKKIVYVSCNPATLVRDIKLFKENGYDVVQPIIPVDQFPQTVHVESITVLERQK